MEKIRAERPSTEPMISRYLNARCASLGIPASATFELTSGCNFNCKMCYIHSAGASRCGELSAEQWISLGRQAQELGVIFLLITGGEPLSRPDFPEIYTALKRMGFVISINTNGSLLGDRITRLFEELPPTRLNISLYGADNGAYGSLCGVPAFEKVIANIRRMQDIGVDVKINCSVTPDNCGDIERLCRLTADMGLNMKLTTYMYPPVRRDAGSVGSNPARFTPEQAAYYRVKYSLLTLGEEEFLRRADNLNAFFDSESECVDDIEAERGVRCRAGRSALWVDRLGNVNPCGMINGESRNALEPGLAECWREVREATAEIRTPAECVNCKLRPLCPVCAAACKCETGRFDLAPKYLCEMSEYTAQFIAERADEIRSKKHEDK